MYLDSSNKILLNAVYYHCELIQLIKDVMIYEQAGIEETNENFEEQIQHEQKKEYVHRLTKKCLDILNDSHENKIQLSRQNKKERGVC